MGIGERSAVVLIREAHCRHSELFSRFISSFKNSRKKGNAILLQKAKLIFQLNETYLILI